MSKTTIVLLISLFLFVGVLLYIIYGLKNQPFITSISAPIRSAVAPVKTSLSFSTGTQSIQPGQTINLAVIIHNPNPHPTIVQLEISYDPTMLTVHSLMPGSFFTNPAVALQNIDPLTGRISYALRCSNSDVSDAATDCVSNDSASTVAVITVSANPYAFKRTTTFSFLPKTVVRTQNGRDILQQTTGLELTVGNSLYPVSSTSAIASPGSNYIRVTPVH